MRFGLLVASRRGARSMCLEAANFGTSANCFPPFAKITPPLHGKVRRLVKFLGLNAVNNLETHGSSELSIGILALSKGLEGSCPSFVGRENVCSTRFSAFSHFGSLTKLERPPIKVAKLQVITGTMK
jgi:hypothetical protein